MYPFCQSHFTCIPGTTSNHVKPPPVIYSIQPFGSGQHVNQTRSYDNSKDDEIRRLSVKLKLQNIRFRRERRRLLRMEKRMKGMKEELKDNRESRTDLIRNPTLRKLINSQVKRYKNCKTPYTDFEKTSALSLYYACGPNGYNTLLKMGFKMPSKRSLLRWMSEFKVMTGLNESLLQSIKNITSDYSSSEKDCIICWDEMSIKEYIEYNQFYDMFEGIIDFGSQGRILDSATEVLVFMARGINSSWKFPISFYFSKNSTPAETLKILLNENVAALLNTGLNVKMGICDMSFCNQKLYRLLGVSSSLPYAYLSNCKIRFIHDVPHLLKLVRNNLMKHDFKQRVKVGTSTIIRNVRWSHIVRFYRKDKRVPSRFAPRLTSAHVYLKDYSKMKVKLAAQVLSHSVYSGITTMCMLKLLGKEFLDTAFFVKQIDEMFDFLNMSSMTNDKWGRCAKYFYLNIHKLDQFLNFISSIEIPTMAKYPDFLRGLTLTLSGIKDLSIELKSNGYSHIFTRNMQQDCLEYFFSKVRAKGGDCRNPTARQFRCNFRFLFFARLVHAPTTGNAQLVNDRDEHLEIYTNMRKAMKKSETVNESQGGTCQSNDCISNLSKKDASLFYSVKLIQRLKLGNEQEASVASYIGGAAIHAFLKKYKCDDCSKLVSKRSDIDLDDICDYAFIDLKRFNPNSDKLIYLDRDTADLFQHSNKSFIKFCTSTLKENGTKIIYSIVEKYCEDVKTSEWVHNLESCIEHRKIMLKYFIKAKLYRIVKDKNDHMKQVKCWNQTRRELRNQ